MRILINRIVSLHESVGHENSAIYEVTRSHICFQAQSVAVSARDCALSAQLAVCILTVIHVYS